MRAFASTVVLLTLASTVAAQEEGPWELEGEFGAALFFGNTSQTTVSTGVEAAQADSAKEIGLKGTFTYGEATGDEGDRFVNKRSWLVGVEYDRRPFGDWNPFVSGEIQSSFERRIDFRYTIGAGVKHTVQRSDRGRVGVRLSILAEQTNPAGEPGEEPKGELLGRWALRATLRRTWDDGRLTFETDNDYRPELDRISDVGVFGEFVFTSKSSIAFRLNETVSLKLTLLDTFDSEAATRGAESNNDGQFIVSVLASF